LESELRKLKNYPSFKECKTVLEQLAHRYGFLKCRQVFETPYTAEDLFAMSREVLDEPREFDRTAFEEKTKKYFHQEHLPHRMSALRDWMRIRNQEMEYILFSFLSIRPLIHETCQVLSIEMQDFWRSRRKTLLAAVQDPKRELKPIPCDRLTILKVNGNMIFSDKLQIQIPRIAGAKTLKGRTVYGSGILDAEVHVAFTPEEFTVARKRPCVLDRNDHA
jgi:hypothetical protein